MTLFCPSFLIFKNLLTLWKRIVALKKVLQTRDLTFHWQIPVIFFKKCLSGFFLAWELNCSELPGAVWPGSTLDSAVCTLRLVTSVNTHTMTFNRIPVTSKVGRHGHTKSKSSGSSHDYLVDWPPWTTAYTPVQSVRLHHSCNMKHSHSSWALNHSCWQLHWVLHIRDSISQILPPAAGHSWLGSPWRGHAPVHLHMVSEAERKEVGFHCSDVLGWGSCHCRGMAEGRMGVGTQVLALG